jgi:ERCC4-related helicase
MIQRMGRVMRRKSDGRDARCVILFANGTDEDPRLGAHESFVDELVEVARTSMITTTANLSELRAALDAQSD